MTFLGHNHHQREQEKNMSKKQESVVEVREYINTRSHMWKVPEELHPKHKELFTSEDSVWKYLNEHSDAIFTLNTAHEIVNATLTKSSLVDGDPMSCGKINLHVSNLSDKQLRDIFINNNFIPSFILPRPSLDKRDVSRLWMHKRGVVILYHEESSGQSRDNIEAHFYWNGKQPEDFEKVYEQLKNYYSDKAKKNPNVNVIIQTPNGFQIQTAGEVTHKFDPENYEPPIVNLYQKVCETVRTKNFEKGRLWLMHGKPGTGKTYLIRGLINEVGRDATFLMIPPDLILQVGSPGMISVFLNHASNSDGKPLVIILEDADKALAPRDGSNISFIQSILNLTAGILGDALNVAILATTNVDKVDIEPALIRSGRLAEIAEFGDLSKEKAEQIYVNLLLKKDPNISEDAITLLVSKNITKPMTLSEVYALTYESKGPTEEELKSIGLRNTTKVGFRNH